MFYGSRDVLAKLFVWTWTQLGGKKVKYWWEIYGFLTFFVILFVIHSFIFCSPTALCEASKLVVESLEIVWRGSFVFRETAGNTVFFWWFSIFLVWKIFRVISRLFGLAVSQKWEPACHKDRSQLDYREWKERVWDVFACLVDSQKLTSFFVVFGIGIFLDGKGEGKVFFFWQDKIIFL